MIIVCDLDGTIANNDHRQVYVQEGTKKDWNAFYDPQKIKEDVPYPMAKVFFAKLANIPILDHHLVFLTGRPERTRGVTAWWLHAHYGVSTIPEDQGAFLQSAPRGAIGMLVMKGDTDYRKANVYKGEKIKRLSLQRPGETFIFIDDDERCYEEFWQYGIVLRPPEAWAAVRGAL